MTNMYPMQDARAQRARLAEVIEAMDFHLGADLPMGQIATDMLATLKSVRRDTDWTQQYRGRLNLAIRTCERLQVGAYLWPKWDDLSATAKQHWSHQIDSMKSDLLGNH